MKKTYLYGAMAVGLLFTACKSDDLPTGPDNQVSDVDKTVYVNMNIRGDVSGYETRAEGDPVFDAGTGESRVKDAYFVFYDANGNLVGEIVKVTLPDPTTVTDGNGSVEKYYQSTVPVAVYKGESDPTQVVCYINPITPASLQNRLDVIQTNTRDILYTGTTDKLFAMSNSVYYPDNDNPAGEPQIAVSVENKLYNTQAEAQAALEANKNVVDIYVERYASKLKFTNTKADDYETATSMINDPAEIPVKLSFNAKKWVVNAACTETYIVKSFRKEASDNKPLADNYTFGELNSRINALSIGSNNGEPTYSDELSAGNAWVWNTPAFHRSYWAMSPAYFTSKYPEVSSDVTEELEGNLNQHYYSYNELTKGSTPAGYGADDSDPHYFHETTVGARGLNSKNPAAAVPSVILVGDYTLNLNNVDLDEGTTFFTYLTGSAGKPLVYFEAAGDEGKSIVNGGESMLRRFLEQTSILFKQVDGGYLPYDITDEVDLKKLVAVLEVEAPSTEVKDGMKIAERYRTLQFIEDADTDGIFIATADGYQSIGDAENQISLTAANQALMQQVGFCNKYETGSAYFNIPVKHYGWYRGGNSQKDNTAIDWNIVRIGDFGMVRNHSYDLSVSEITGLATGIGGHDSPIVPPSDTKDYFVAYRVNILKWAVVPTQTVKL